MVSVIIPVYNLEKVIGACLDTVCSQSYPGLEILVVDDGSTDRSAAAVERYRTKDSRLRMIRKANGGVSSARNRGIEEAQGEFITFVDGDDVCSPVMIETLMSQMAPGTVLSQCGYKEISDKDEDFEKRAGHGQTIGFMRYLPQLVDGRQDIGAFGKIYRKKDLDGLRFNEKIRYNEDKLFLVEYVLKNRGDIAASDAVLYGYIQHGSSASHSPYDSKKLDIIKANRLILDKIRESAPELTSSAEFSLQVARLQVLKCIIESGKYEAEKTAFQKIKSDLLNAPFKTWSLERRLERLALLTGDAVYIFFVHLYRTLQGSKI